MAWLELAVVKCIKEFKEEEEEKIKKSFGFGDPAGVRIDRLEL